MRVIASEARQSGFMAGMAFSYSPFLGDPDYLQYPRHRLDLSDVEGVGIADHPDDGPVGAGRLVNVEVLVYQEFLYPVERRFVGAFLHDDQHTVPPCSSSLLVMIRSSLLDSSTTRSNSLTIAWS